MKTNRRLSVAFTVMAALGICLLSGADAGQITFGPSMENITFTGNGAHSVSISISGLTGPGFYTGDALLGAFKFGPAAFTAGPGPNIYSASSSGESFEFTGAGSLKGTITWSYIQDGTPQPKFYGSLLVATASGSPAFLSDFAMGTTVPVDFVMNIMAGASSLDFLSGTTGSATATISSGQVMPDAGPGTLLIPQPATILLLGVAVLGLAVGLRRRSGRGV